MAKPPLGRRLQGLYWDLNQPIRQQLRSLRKTLSLVLHRARHLAKPDSGPRVVSTMAKAQPKRISAPAVTIIGAAETGDATFVAHGEGLDRLPEAHIEAMLMAAAAEGLSWVAAGWASPAPGRYGPSGLVMRDPETPEPAHLLLRSPTVAHAARAPVVGRVLPHITAMERCHGLIPFADHNPASGPYRIRPEMAGAPLLECQWFPVDEALAELPPVDGPPTILFLLPFLAVGGAERLLFELMEGLGDRYRLLVVTTDPHLESFGQTVDRARDLTPHTYTLGDWLPREAVPSAIRHLIRRWHVRTLMCWNGSVLFYDEAAALCRTFPRLRIVNQLFNHRGGWIEHFSPSLIRTVDTQIAVNTPIAQALVAERGVPEDRVVTIHHAVGTPKPRDEDRRARLRSEFGVDDDTLVVGSFIRMHPQKRPLDIIRLARRMTDDKIHFLLVGGGPLDDAVNREIARDQPPNLTRWPLQQEASPLYDAIDLCLMTSDFEGLPVFLLDGLARGIPCVATAVGDIPLLLRDGGGRVVEQPGDLDALAAGVRTYLDSEHRFNDGERGRRSVATRFGLDRYVNAYEAAIDAKPDADIPSS